MTPAGIIATVAVLIGIAIMFTLIFRRKPARNVPHAHREHPHRMHPPINPSSVRHSSAARRRTTVLPETLQHRGGTYRLHRTGPRRGYYVCDDGLSDILAYWMVMEMLSSDQQEAWQQMRTTRDDDVVGESVTNEQPATFGTSDFGTGGGIPANGEAGEKGFFTGGGFGATESPVATDSEERYSPSRYEPSYTPSYSEPSGSSWGGGGGSDSGGSCGGDGGGGGCD